MNRRPSSVHELKTTECIDQHLKQYWAICNVCRRKPEPPEETYSVGESHPLYHMRNGFDRESNPRPRRGPALMLISNIDLTTVPLWQPVLHWFDRFYKVLSVVYLNHGVRPFVFRKVACLQYSMTGLHSVITRLMILFIILMVVI
jgi:hypothetical protein